MNVSNNLKEVYSFQGLGGFFIDFKMWSYLNIIIDLYFFKDFKGRILFKDFKDLNFEFSKILRAKIYLHLQISFFVRAIRPNDVECIRNFYFLKHCALVL